jgi:hypothetical protein
MFTAPQTISATSTAPVQISGAVLVPTATPRRAAAHAPAPTRVVVTADSDDTAWSELERVMAARAASMAAHPTARRVPLQLAS